jgi:hypothetical protein
MNKKGDKLSLNGLGVLQFWYFQGVKLFMVVDFTCWAPFGLIQFYFLFSGREHAGIGGRNGGGNNY